MKPPLAALFACLALTFCPAHAAQRVVYGDVIAVEPLGDDTGSEPQACELAPKPEASAGLAEVLAWDLVERPESEARCEAALAQRVQGYRVTYEWNGHRFEDVLPSHPGKRIPLTLEID